MSGNPGSGNFGVGFDSGESIPNCDNVSAFATINSPNPAALAKVSVGDTVSITLASQRGPIQAHLSDGSLLGSVFVAGEISRSLITCLNDGHTFKGKVTRIAGAQCELLITPS